MVQHGGDGWVVEENRTTVPGAPSQTCFVASFRWCRKKQVLDLEKEGLWPELLDSGKIEICVSDWWGARHDSGCKYRLFVKLLDATQTVLDKFSAVPDPIEQWNNDICLQMHPQDVFDPQLCGDHGTPASRQDPLSAPGLRCPPVSHVPAPGSPKAEVALLCSLLRPQHQA
ncbi:F-box only protein 27 isoform X1 [Fukomys damarensis]|uniref:F-box only protein 27 isoform X1 n=1 Tax=Fukomys damarensis TaxID=885580 RepID=UPI00053FA60C|nr:F-box only protein 27 isoform X1 [Fukomys damarensis]